MRWGMWAVYAGQLVYLILQTEGRYDAARGPFIVGARSYDGLRWDA